MNKQEGLHGLQDFYVTDSTGRTKSLQQLIEDHQLLLKEIDDANLSYSMIFDENYVKNESILMSNFRTDPRRLILKGTVDSKLIIQNLTFQHINLQYVIIENVKFINCTFINSIISFSKIRDTEFDFEIEDNNMCETLDLDFCKLSNVIFHKGTIYNSTHLNCDYYDCLFRSQLFYFIFENCSFTNSIIKNEEGENSNVDIIGSNLYFSNPKELNLSYWTLNGIKIESDFFSQQSKNKNFLKNDIILGLNGIHSVRTNSTAFYRLYPKSHDQLAGDINSILRCLERARTQLGYVFVLSLSAILFAFKGMFHLDGSDYSNLRIPILEIPLNEPLLILIALPVMIVLLYEISSFVYAARKSSNYLKRKEEVHTLSSFPWILTKYVPSGNKLVFPKIRKKDFFLSNNKATFIFRHVIFSYLHLSIIFIKRNWNMYMAFIFRFIYCFGSIFPFIFILINTNIYEKSCSYCTGKNINLFFLFAALLSLFAFFQMVILFRHAQSFQLPILIEDNDELDDTEDENSIPKSLEEIANGISKLISLMKEIKDSNSKHI